MPGQPWGLGPRRLTHGASEAPQVGAGDKQEEPFPPSPSVCSDRGVLRLSPWAAMPHWSSDQEGTTPGRNLSALKLAHFPQPPPKPHSHPGLFSASEPVGGTEQTALVSHSRLV